MIKKLSSSSRGGVESYKQETIKIDYNDLTLLKNIRKCNILHVHQFVSCDQILAMRWNVD
jgi:hypothetical protein